MGLAQDTAICTIAQAEGITHEPRLASLDDADADTTVNATFQAALNEATNELIRRCKLKWAVSDPSTIAASTVTDMRAFAAFWAVSAVLLANEDAEVRERGASYADRAEKQWHGLVVAFTSGTGTVTEAPLGLPRWSNTEPDPYHRPTNNRAPGRLPRGPYNGKPRGLLPPP